MIPPRSAQRRRRLSALAAGLAVVGAVAVASPAAAANADVTATLRITIRGGDSVMTQTNGEHTCHPDFTPGDPKDVVVTVPEGQWVQAYATDGCYGVADGSLITGVTVTSEAAAEPIIIDL